MLLDGFEATEEAHKSTIRSHTGKRPVKCNQPFRALRAEKKVRFRQLLVGPRVAMEEIWTTMSAGP